MSTTLGSAVHPRLTEARQLVDGAWAPPASVLADQLIDPASGSGLQPQVESSADDVQAALDAAWRAHVANPDGIGSPDQRADALRRAADRFETLTDEIAVQDSINSGVPIAITRLFAGSLAGTLRAAADRIPELAAEDLSADGRRVWLHRLPLGPAVVLAPWNAPTAVAAKKAAFAWAAGCPVTIKPSPWSPNGTVLLVQAIAEAAAESGLPAAAVQLVLGGTDVGALLVASPLVRAISFTGSRPGGRAVAAAAQQLAALQLELGSNNPAVVLADADVRETASALAAGMSKLNGAWCEAPGTVFVPQQLREPLIDALTECLAQLRVGPPLDPEANFGPQSNPVQWRSLRERLDAFARAGARTVTVGDVPEHGLWLAPTLVVDPPDELVADELFGPVLVLRTCDDPDEAIGLSRRLATGLAGYVFTSTPEQGLALGRRLPAGEVKVNGTSLLDMSPRSAQEFWYGSGVGGHGDAELLRFFTGARIVGEDVDSPL
jgi:phenylacetaldehyde dehydrogenase